MTGHAYETFCKVSLGRLSDTKTALLVAHASMLLSFGSVDDLYVLLCLQIGNYGGMQDEIEALKRDKNVLMLELVRLRQQQQVSKGEDNRAEDLQLQQREGHQQQRQCYYASCWSTSSSSCAVGPVAARRLQDRAEPLARVGGLARYLVHGQCYPQALGGPCKALMVFLVKDKMIIAI